jgi:hypothetical protein
MRKLEEQHSHFRHHRGFPDREARLLVGSHATD